jgi:hypothetical protein
MSPFLFVPTNLQARVVRTPDAQGPWSSGPVRPNNRRKTFSDAMRYWYTGPDQQQNLFPFRRDPLEPLQAGVHLHWALPAALTRRAHGADGETATQPNIPNRWLVLRLSWRQGSDSIASVGWVIESDYLSRTPEAGGTPFPFLGDKRLDELVGDRFGYVGRTVSLSKWKEEHPEFRFDLKSFGWGDPAFASYYPACKGVLGLHDKMEGVAEGDFLSYVVAGWYSQAAADPLQDQTNKPPPGTPAEQFLARLAGLGWSCDLPKGATPPNRILLHGAVVGLAWSRYDEAAASPELKIAIGGSSAEALAALVAGDIPDMAARRSLEPVLCAFQHGQARQLNNPDELNELLHRQGFSAIPGGTRWSIEPARQSSASEREAARRAARSLMPPSPAPPDEQPAPPTMPQEAPGLLRELNAAQIELDRSMQKLTVQRAKLFALWASWASAHTGPPAGRPSRDRLDAEDREDAEIKQFQAAMLAVQTSGAEVKRRMDLLTAALVDTRMRLVESTMPAFMQPKEPFLLVQSLDLRDPGRTQPGGVLAGGRLPLPCRRIDELIGGVTLTGVDRRDWLAERIWPLPIALPAEPGVQDAARRLAREALLFHPESVDWLTRDAAGLDANTLDAVTRLARQLQTRLSPASDGVNTLSLTGTAPELTGTAPELTGTAPDRLALTQWGKVNPFLPLYLRWQVNWAAEYKPKPGQAASAADALLGWRLNPTIVAEELGPGPDKVVADQLLEGVTILSSLSGDGLASGLEEFGKAQDGVVVPVFEPLRETTALGQALGGFNDLLLRQAIGLFLPPIDPRSGQVQVDPIWAAMGRVPQAVLPLPAGDFLPVRAGALRIATLSVVDMFGSDRELIGPRTPADSRRKIIASATLPAPAVSPGHHAHFRPRLLQPARLNFDWLDGGDNLSGPVCGWIVPNFLDKGFDVFSAEGRPLGMLHSALSALGEKNFNSPMKFTWQAIPGSSLEVSGIAAINRHLANFVDLVTQFSITEGQAFGELVELLARKSDGRVPPEDPTMAVLLGRPLALVRASLALELYGAPAGYWEFNNSNWDFKTEGVEKLRVPLRLGGMKFPADGLVGYIADGQPDRFVSSWGAIIRGDFARLRSQQDLSLTCANEPVAVTMLMDLGARVHATTGILPRISVELPPEAARQFALIEEFYIRVAPVLGERTEGGPTMPRPSDVFGRWSWATRPALAWREIRAADDRARFPDDLALAEGWLKLSRRRKGDEPGGSLLRA